MKERKYLITFETRHNNTRQYRQHEVIAKNAKEAKRIFEELWGYRKYGVIPYPFNIKVIKQA
jgi:hypothetical protein